MQFVVDVLSSPELIFICRLPFFPTPANKFNWDHMQTKAGLSGFPFVCKFNQITEWALTLSNVYFYIKKLCLSVSFQPSTYVAMSHVQIHFTDMSHKFCASFHPLPRKRILSILSILHFVFGCLSIEPFIGTSSKFILILLLFLNSAFSTGVKWHERVHGKRIKICLKIGINEKKMNKYI